MCERCVIDRYCNTENNRVSQLVAYVHLLFYPPTPVWLNHIQSPSNNFLGRNVSVMYWNPKELSA